MAQTSQTKNPAQEPTSNKPKWEFDKVYNFRLRRIRGGSFHGLWELCLLNRMGHVTKVISDADALNFCIENLQGELETDGF